MISRLFRLFIIGFFIGIMTMFITQPESVWLPRCFISEKPLNFHGIVSTFPEELSGNAVRFSVTAGKRRMLITTSPFPEFFYGDKLEIFGKPENVYDPLKNYYAVSGTCASISFPVLKRVAAGEGDFVKGKLFLVRRQFVDRIQKIFHEPRALLAASILLGRQGKSVIDDDFRKSGLSHITALSGFNITILIVFISALLRNVRPRSRFLGTVFIIMLFVILTGGEPSVTRAAIMGILFLYSKAAGRSQKPVHSLLIAGFFMVLLNPLVLAYDLGFQLSFAATISMIFFTKFFDALLSRITRLPDSIREIFTATLSAQILVTPIIIFRFGAINPFIIFSNLLVVPFIPLIMLLTFLSVILHMLSVLHMIIGTGALFAAFYADLLIRWMIFVARIFAPFAVTLGTDTP